MSEALPDFQFYRETRFKEVELNGRKVRIPEEWEVVELRDIAEDMYYGVTAKAVTEKTDFRILRTTDINNYQADWENLPFCKITDTKRNLDKYTLKEGDIIIARAGTVGVSVVVPRDMSDIIFGSYLIKVVLNKAQAEPQFVHYYFQSPFYWTQIRQSAAGGVLKNINLPTLRGIKLPLPPLEEQKKIAEVLRTIDEAIQAVDEGIAKLERLKKGAMERLLTRGINHTRFKEVELNGRKVRIPEEWDVIKFGNIALQVVDGTHKTPKYTSEGIPFISTQNLVPFREHFDFSQYRKFISPEEHKELIKRCKPEKGDLLISKCGTIGRTQVVRVDYEFSIFVGVALVKVDKNKADPDYLEQLLNLDLMRKYMEDLSPGATRKTLTLKAIKQMKLFLPPLSEQKKIAEILRTIDEAIEAKRAKKEKLERMKKAVMEKLLTGKVRIR